MTKGFWATMRSSELKRSGPIGAVKKARHQAERDEAKVFEDWLDLHGWNFHHDYMPMRGQGRFTRKGYPDYTLWRERVVFVELKARSALTKRIGKLSGEQRVVLSQLENAGAETYVIWLPDDWALVEEKLA